MKIISALPRGLESSFSYNCVRPVSKIVAIYLFLLFVNVWWRHTIHVYDPSKVLKSTNSLKHC